MSTPDPCLSTRARQARLGLGTRDTRQVDTRSTHVRAFFGLDPRRTGFDSLADSPMMHTNCALQASILNNIHAKPPT